MDDKEAIKNITFRLSKIANITCSWRLSISYNDKQYYIDTASDMVSAICPEPGFLCNRSDTNSIRDVLWTITKYAEDAICGGKIPEETIRLQTAKEKLIKDIEEELGGVAE